MKYLMIFLLPLTAAAANECLPQLQFIGTAKHVQKAESGCSFHIDFSQANENILCPLAEGEASEVNFLDAACKVKEGDFLSGVITKESDNSYSIDTLKN